MDNSKQALIRPPLSFIGHYENWIPLGYVAAALLAVAVVLAASQGPGIPDPSFASASVLP